MNIYKKTAMAAACLTLVLTGCASQNAVKRYSTCSGKSFNQLLESTELKPLFNDIARELCSEPCVGEEGAPTGTKATCSSGNDSTDYSILITDFVDNSILRSRVSRAVDGGIDARQPQFGLQHENNAG